MPKKASIAQVIRKVRAEEKEPPMPEPQDEPLGVIAVKVPLSLRRHWAAAAKAQGTSMTAVILKALEEAFGKP